MLTFIFAMILSAASFAEAQVRFAPIEGQYQAKGEYQYLTTSSNYNSGTYNSMGAGFGTKLTRMLGVFEGSYDYSPAIRVWGGFSGGQTTAIVVDQNSITFPPGTKTQVNSGLNEGWLGGQWWTELNKIDIVPQVDFTFPFFRIDQTSNNPLLGEGAMRFQGGAWAMYPLEMLTPFVYGGLAFRDGGRSMLFPYSFGARYGTETQWWLQIELRGSQSLADNSSESDRITRDAYLNSSNGGSYEFYSYGASRSEIAGMAGLRFEQFGIYGGGSKTIWGRNSADDWEIRFGVTFNGLTRGSVQRVKRGGSPAQPVFKPDGFQEDAVKYDETLFQDEVTPKPVDQQQLHQRSQSQRTVKKKARPAPEVPMPNVELLMKDTQKSLEKRKGR